MFVDVNPMKMHRIIAQKDRPTAITAFDVIDNFNSAFLSDKYYADFGILSPENNFISSIRISSIVDCFQGSFTDNTLVRSRRK